MEIRRVPVAQIKMAPYNPRKDLKPGDPEYEALRRSIGHWGLVEPLVWNERTGRLVGGHQRLKVLIEQGVQEVEVSVVNLDEHEEKALNLALNKIQGDWDEDKLRAVLLELDEHGVDLALTGFSEAEFEDLVGGLAGGGSVTDQDEDELPELPPEPVTRPGDLILMGEHRLLCGDARDPDSVRRLLGGQKVDLLVTSPPYNVGVRYQSYDDREVDRDDYLTFLRQVLRIWVPAMAPGRFVAWNVWVSPKTYHYHQALLLEEVGLQFWRQLVWVKKGIPVPHFYSQTKRHPEARRYHPSYRHEVIYLATAGEPRGLVYDPSWDHELVYLFSTGPPEYGSPIMLPGAGESDVWDFINQSTTSRDIPDAPQGAEHHSNLDRRSVKLHPATFPVALPQTLMGYLTAPGETVLDPFCGAGTTILAAEKMKRVAFGVEIGPVYCDLAVMRWERMTGRKAERRPKEEW